MSDAPTAEEFEQLKDRISELETRIEEMWMDMAVAQSQQEIEPLDDDDLRDRGVDYDQDEDSFSGTAYIAGKKITGLNSSAKPWVKCNIDAMTATQEDGPPPDPMPSNQEWYYKNETYGDIHLVRA